MKKIFLVEDEMLIALEITSRLERLGYEVCGTAVNSEQAIKQIETLKPNLVLMDINIEGELDGIETSKLINSPVIYITAYSDSDTLNRAKETNPYGYLTKPIVEKELRITLELAIQRIKIERELEKTKEQLYQSEKRNTTIINSLPDIIFIISYEGVILDYNSSNSEGLLLQPSDFLDKNIQEILPDEISSKALPAIQNCINNNSIEIFEYETTENSTVINYEARAIKLNEKESLVVIRDISNIKLHEIELKKAKEKAEESDYLKSAFLANMSHEIRTPMNAILGFSELMATKDLSDEKKKKYFEYIHNSGIRLLNIISDIVDISKIEANQVNVKLNDCNLNQILNNLNSQFEVANTAKKLKLITSFSLADDNCFIQTDENRLYQIISNLLENSFKFTKEGSIEFGYEVIKDNLQFYVKDTGIGINKYDLDKIFNRFIQSENKSLTYTKGNGLGLAICKGIVDLLGGRIWVESEINSGACFYFTIPYIVSKSIEKNTVSTEHNSDLISNSLTILLAEDEDANFYYFEEILDKYNVNILRAVNGIEAINICKTEKVDLVFMDINMPVLGGYEAVKEIRKINLEVPIIAQTAYAMLEDRQKAIESGCNDYISKPINRNELMNLISKYQKQIATSV